MPATSNFVFLFTPVSFCILLLLSWSGPAVLIWYSHLLFTNWHYRFSFFILVNFTLCIITYNLSFYFTTNDVYDYYIVLYNFLFWFLFFFSSNNFFTIIFFIELLSTLVILLITTSTFSSTYFYNTRTLTQHSYFHMTNINSFVRMSCKFS